MVNPHIRAFTRLFSETARYHNRYTVFADFCELAAISIQNAFLKSDELEQEYLKIVKRYEKDDAIRMSHLLAEVVMGLEVAPCDFLGSVYMELELGSKHLGAYYTPFEVALLSAKLTFNNGEELLKERPFITLHEPCVGAAAYVIAFAQVMYERGFNPQQQLWVSCIDIDPVAARMAYLQLALLGIPAEVIVGNSLSMKFTKVMRTPAHYLGLWDSKLRRHWSNDEAQKAVIVEDAPTAAPQPMVVIDKGQMSLFDISA